MNRQQKIAELKAQIAELEKITSEQRFLELIDGMTIKIDKDKYPGLTFFFKGDTCYLEIQKSILWVRYAEIWQVFEVEFGMKYDEIQSFIKDQMEQHFKMRGATPEAYPKDYGYLMEQHFKMRGATPEEEMHQQDAKMEQHFRMRGATPCTSKFKPRPIMPLFPTDRVEQNF